MSDYERMRPTDLYRDVIKQRETDGRRFYKEYGDSFVEALCPACNRDENDIAFVKWNNTKVGGDCPKTPSPVIASAAKQSSNCVFAGFFWIASVASSLAMTKAEVSGRSGGGYTHCICRVCKTLYVNPRPTEALLGIFYSQYETPKMWTNLLLTADRDRKILQYMPRVQRILEIIGGNQNEIAVDLGAGSGAFASCLMNTGRFSKVIALDISQKCVDACKNQGIESYCGSIEMLEPDSVDVIFINDMVEHLFDPLGFLSGCFNTLRRGGSLCLATPSGQGFDFKILKENTENVVCPEHLNFFNPESISLLLTSVGFSELLVETPGILDVDIVSKARMKGHDIASRNEYIDTILDLGDSVKSLFQRFLQEVGLSSHMLAVAKK